MLYTKYESSGPLSFRQDFFKLHFENLFFDLLMQPIRTIWTILVHVGEHIGTIPVEFGRIPISSSREEVICSFPYINQCKIVTPQGRVNFDPRNIIWTNSRGPLDDVIYTKYESSGPCRKSR